MFEDYAFTYARWAALGRQVARGERATWSWDDDQGCDVPLFLYSQTYEVRAIPKRLCPKCLKKVKKSKKSKAG